MSTEKENYQEVFEAAKKLPPDLRLRLIEELTDEMEKTVTPLKLVGRWKGVSISAEEIDEARRECWSSMGDDQ
ncbi:MAG: hypothetical protein AB1631_24780 [Acidobacteriota bacterium]